MQKEGKKYFFFISKGTKHIKFCNHIFLLDGARGGAVGWRCATSWEVAGSIPDGVIGFFH